jgi:putative membrane protein
VIAVAIGHFCNMLLRIIPPFPAKYEEHEMKTTILALAISTLPLAAMAQMAPASSATMSSTSSALSAHDKQFIKSAAIAGLSEVKAGQVAEQNGDASVKNVGQTMVTDHTKANDQLAALSQQLGDPAPTMLPASQTAMIAKMQGMTGSSFDKSYLNAQEAAHKKAIALFQSEVTNGSNTQLKQFATETLPTLKAHLSMIQSAMNS